MSQTRIQSSLQLTALLSAVLLTAPPSAAQQPAAQNPHDGEWSLEFSVCTRPGGETIAVGGDTQIFNVLFQVAKESFTVAADGVLKWEQREGGQLHVDDYSTLIGRTWFQDQQPVLRLSGQAVATPAAPNPAAPTIASCRSNWNGPAAAVRASTITARPS